MKLAWPARGTLPPWIGPLVALVAVYALFAVLSPETFMRSQVTVSMVQKTVVVGICALGMTMIIATGGIDLSTGSMVAFTSVLIARMLRSGSSALVAVLAACVAGLAIGAAVGLLVGRFRMMPFIVTLGTMSLLRGAAKGLADERKIDADPRGLERLVTADVASPALWIALSLAVAVAAVLVFTRFGRHLFAIGSNEATARLVGIDPARVKVIVYAIATALVAIAGVVEFSTLTVGDPTDAVGLELKVIAAVVIGGASLNGGEGSVAGALIGAFLMTVIETGAVHQGLAGWVQEIVTGAIIVIVGGARSRAR